MKGPRLVDRPGAGQLIGVGQADVAAFVVGEVEVVFPERVWNPLRHTDQGRALNIDPDSWTQVGSDDRIRGETANGDIRRPLGQHLARHHRRTQGNQTQCNSNEAGVNR